MLKPSKQLSLMSRQRVWESPGDGPMVELLRERWRVEALVPLGFERTTTSESVEHPARRATVVLVHGLAQNHHSWRVHARSLPAWLARRGHEVISIDLRGHGLSRRYGGSHARRVQDYAEDLQVLRQALGRPFFAVGHSLGGAVGILAAPGLGEGMLGLVHLGGVYTFARRNIGMRALTAGTRALRPWLPADLRVSVRGAGRLIARNPGIVERLNALSPTRGWTPGSLEKNTIAERMGCGFDSSGLGIWMQMCDWAAGQELEEETGAFARSGVPMLALAGRGDSLADEGDARAAYEAAGPDRQLVVLGEGSRGPGHLDIVLGREAPRSIWPLIGDWIEGRASMRH